jgi:magnesium chelatase family protein
LEYFFRKKNGTIKVSLPTDIRKEGSAYDLTLAIGILAASEQIVGASELEDYYIVGELSLDGSRQPEHRNRASERGHQFPESG